MEQQRNRWQEIGEKTRTRMETFSKEEAEGASSLEETLRAEHRERYQYREFLRRFAVLREEMTWSRYPSGTAGTWRSSG